MWKNPGFRPERSGNCVSETTSSLGSTPAPLATAQAEGKVPARALLGWLRDDEAARYLAGSETGGLRNPLHRELVRRARATVAARSIYAPAEIVRDELPADVLQHIEVLRAHPENGSAIAALGDARLVNLSAVIAGQKQIVVSEALPRVQDARADDLLGLAKITLPMPRRETISNHFDPARNAFILASPNHNLRVVGHFNSTIGGDAPGAVFNSFGFAVSFQRSYLQVAVIEGRHILCDGYHRAYGLLHAGIHWVPAFVRDVPSWEAAQFPGDFLSREICTGPRPPLLVDYLDDSVAIDRWATRMSRVVVVQALELTVPT